MTRTKSGRKLAEMQTLAAQHGGQCLSKRFIDMKTPLKWRCAEGHSWKTAPRCIKRGSWCEICRRKEAADNKRIYSIDTFVKIAEEHGGRCLSTSYKNSTTRLEFECCEGHTWTALSSNIIRGNWCKKCAAAKTGEACRKYSLADLQAYADSNGGFCLATEYKNVNVAVQWKCARGHCWKAKPADVLRRKTWCPKCAPAKRAQTRSRYTLEDMQGLAEDKDGAFLSKSYRGRLKKHKWECKHGHRWMTTPRTILRGSWCPKCRNIASGNSNRKYTIADMHTAAAANDGLCLSKSYKNITTGIRWQCAKGHKWSAPYSSIKAGAWCPKCASARAAKANTIYDIADMQKLAEERSGKCHSRKYRNTVTRLSWECSEGHRFMMTAGLVLSDSWCPKCATKLVAKKQQRHTIEEMQEIAKSKGGTCLSEEYVNVHAHLRWECAEGHRWSSSANNIIAGRWCRKCSCAKAGRKRRQYTIEQMQEIAEKKGGKCLSTGSVLVLVPLEWECARGHRFSSTPSNIMNGSWCRKCSSLDQRFRYKRRERKAADK